MAPSGPDVPSPMSWLASRPWARLAVPLAFIAVLLSIDLATGPQFRIGGLMVAVPALSAGFLGPGYVLVVVGVTLPAVVVASAFNNTLDVANFPVAFTTVVLIGAASVATAAVRRRREQELAQVRWVAAITQKVLLRPLPGRLGPLEISSLYLAADEEASIGGDLYAAATLGGRVRLMVGDVQGKGLGAVEMAGYLLGAFRRSARHGLPLRELPGYLDRRLREDLTDAIDDESDESPESAAADRRKLEGFVTAVLVDFTDGDDLVEIANRGHPPPMLIHRGKVRVLDAGEPALPLGLGDLDGNDQRVDSHDLVAGDTLLLYTDGVVEARDSSGTFYPLADRLAAWTSCGPEELLEAVRADLLDHVGSGLADDVAMVAVRRKD